MSPTFRHDATSFATQTVTTGLTRLVSKYVAQGSQKQITERLPMTSNDTMDLASFIALPLPVIQYSKIGLPNATIYDRANLGQCQFQMSRLLNYHTTLQTVDISAKGVRRGEVMTEAEVGEERAKNAHFVAATVITNFNTAGAGTYGAFVDNLVPRTRAIFHLMRDHFTHTQSITLTNIVNQLEPFLI